MHYFTTEELTREKRGLATKLLSDLSGKNVRYGLALNLFKEWAVKLSWPKEIKVLDLGAASGSFTEQLFSLGYKNLYAVDLDAYIPTERNAILKEFKTADLSLDRLPWPDDYFDVVTAWCILPHLENPFHCLRESARVLKNGGVFMFSALHLTSKPSIDYLLKHGHFGSYRETNNHISLLPPSVVKKTSAGFFDLVGTDYLVIPKIFSGWRGRLRLRIYNLADRFPNAKNYLKERWGYNIVYVLRKKRRILENDS